MREIKFRAFYQGRYFYFTIGQGFTDFELSVYHSICLNGIKFEQFTGLHDKNGKESYYNDIVRGVEINGTYCDCMIKEIKGCFVFRQMGAEYLSIPMFEVKSSMWEVIGNIHKNPELIK